MAKDLRYGQRAFTKLSREVKAARRMRRDGARALLAEAQSRAASSPTPQARMVAAAMIATGGMVLGRGGKRVTNSRGRSIPLGKISFGAEFGSTSSRQFRPRNERGYWLHPPGGVSQKVLSAARSALDEIIGECI